MIIILIGIGMYITGAICKYAHDDYSQYPNISAGYKMKSAMKNKENWEEANNYIYKACKMDLAFSIIFTLLTNLMDLNLSKWTYFIVEMLTLIGPIVLTEIHLYKFNKNGGLNE